MVLGVNKGLSGPPELLPLEKQQVVIPNSSPQWPGERRATRRWNIHADWAEPSESQAGRQEESEGKGLEKGVLNMEGRVLRELWGMHGLLEGAQPFLFL